jgi:DNA-binding beta-propeller fold protein YncE
MVVTPNKVQTLVFSPPDSRLTFISNSAESASASITLSGFTESFLASPDSQTLYIAVPTGPVIGQSPGVVVMLSLNTGNLIGEINVPAARYLSLGHSGNRLLAFSDNSNKVSVISFGKGNPTVTQVDGFDRPVTAFFSVDDNTAYIVNCGFECGGTQASVQTLDLSQDPPVAGVQSPVAAATVAVQDGTTLYLAGTPFPASPCTGQTTAATSCGLLTVFDLASMSVVQPPVAITDGYHNRMALGADGQFFVGAHHCSEIIPPLPPPPDVETRGCLSIYNSTTGTVVIPPANGDATGIEPIPGRHVVYVAQGGQLQIYDTRTDLLQKTQIDISGEVIDVKVVDF